MHQDHSLKIFILYCYFHNFSVVFIYFFVNNRKINPGGLITNFAADLKDILYTISYVTTANLRMRTSKTTKLKHNVILTNNQQNSFVDLQLRTRNTKIISQDEYLSV